jgi:hypothetical protein
VVVPIVFSFSGYAEDEKGYTVTVPSLLIQNKSYTFSVNKNNRPPANCSWNFGEDANPSTSGKSSVEVTYTTPGVKIITLTVKDSNKDIAIEKQVFVSEQPDNVEDVGCYVNPETTNWQPAEKGKSEEATGEDKVHILAQPFVGDIDGDEKSEVVTSNKTTSGTYTHSNKILIFDNELKLKKSISTPSMYSNSATPIVLLRLKPTDTHALIIIATDGEDKDNNLKYKLQAYKSDGTLVWTSNASIFNDKTTSVKDASISLVAGDINNDGIPDILAGDRIFNASNGKLVASLLVGGRGYRFLNTQNPMYMPALADMNNDGRLEVVTGNTVYKVTINDPDDASKNTVVILSQATGVDDGFVSVADIDRNGQLDVVMIKNGNESSTGFPILTVWNGATGNIIAGPASPSVKAGGGSRVFIGNVDEDAHPELFFSYINQLVRFDYDGNAVNVKDRLKQTWNVKTSDASGGTTLSMFDFDQDGKAELVYRDMTDLRIIEGTDGSNRKTFPCFSATHSEYPIVVDFNRDGHADILVSGAVKDQTYADVRLYWFSGEKNDWAPARTVWNQHGYNAVHVNEDLTIPKYQLNPAMTFAGPDQVLGTADDVYPYNGFLQQQTSLSGDGVPFYKAPRADFLEPESVVYDYNADTDVLHITNVKVKNSGDAVLPKPMKITVYKEKVEAPAIIYTHDYDKDIAIGETIMLNFDIPNFKKWLPAEGLIIRVNDAGNGGSFHRVCDDKNVENTTDAFMYIPLGKLAWADGYRKCEGGEVVFQADEKLHNDKVTFSWRTPTPASKEFSTEKEATLTDLKLSDAGRYVFQAKVNNQLNITATLPYLSVAPAVMYWRTDAENSNWNNRNNWAKSATMGDNISAVPAPCTRVVLPGSEKTKVYPSLSDENTDRSLYGEPEADEIVFNYGSQLHYQHKLKYNRAFIQYNWGYYKSDTPTDGKPTNWEEGRQLSRNTWHILAAPLKKMASGDFSLAGRPFSWQSQFQKVTNPGGLVEVGDLSKSFPENNIDLVDNNNAIAVKMAGYQSGKTGYKNQENLDGLKGVLEIPYFENKDYPGHNYDALSKKSSFYYFDTKTLKLLNSPVGSMLRGNEAYRFVYETQNNEAPTDEVYTMTVNTKDLGTSNEVMIGNPLLADIDAAAFAEVNASTIDPAKGYKLLSEEDGTWKQHQFNPGGIIPAWKAFIVTLNSSGASTVSFPLTATNTRSASTTARASYTGAVGNSLSLQLLKEGAASGDAAVLQNNQDGNSPEVRKMILPEGHATPEVFFIDSEKGAANLIQHYTPGQKEVTIGVKTSDTRSRLSLEFGNIPAFIASTGAKAILKDTYLNIKQDLVRNPVYTFTQRASGLDKQSVDKNRFILQLTNETVRKNDADEGINILYRSGILKITSDENIGAIYIYDSQGRLVHSAHSVNFTEYTHRVSLRGGIFLIQVRTISGKLKVEKINGLSITLSALTRFSSYPTDMDNFINK